MITYCILIGFYAYFFYAKNYYKNEISYYKNEPPNHLRIKRLVAVLVSLAVFFALIIISTSVGVLLMLNVIPAIFCLVYLKALNIRINRIKKKGG